MPKSGFKPPDKERRAKALGRTDPKTVALKKAIEGADKFWIPTRIPEKNDWLDLYNHAGQGYEKFGGKKYSDKHNTLYIQPITYDKGSKITSTLL